MTDIAQEDVGSDLFVFALEANREDAAVKAVILLGRLEQLTGWPQPVLRRRLGCRFTKHVGKATAKQADDAVKHSLDYLSWVVELASLVSLERDCRDVVCGAYELCAGADGPMSERVARCQAAVDRSPEGSLLSAREYITLGEINQAWHVAALQLDAGSAKQQAELAESLLSPLEQHRPHVHPARLALLGRADAISTLGERVHRAMLVHCMLCTSCRAHVTPGVSELAA
jgi:hypothetical protein